MSSLIPQNSKKSDRQIAEEARVMRARSGHAAFSRSFADMAGNTIETGPRAAAAFVSGMGGSTNAPTVTAERQAQKADVLSALPANAKRAAERYDEGTQAFVAMVYRRSAEVKGHVCFTDAEAGAIMQKDEEKARRTVEALVSAQIIAPAYSAMGTLKGYLPAIHA